MIDSLLYIPMSFIMQLSTILQAFKKMVKIIERKLRDDVWTKNKENGCDIIQNIIVLK